MNDMTLQDDIALVTGAAQGIGAATVRALAAQGARVVATDVADELGEALADELGDRVIYHHLDVANEGHWQSALAAATQTFGTVSVLVNNAGVCYDSPLEEYSLEGWNQVISVNQTGALLGMKHVAVGMKQLQRGSIINISSVQGLRGAAFQYAYVASKWAMRGLTKCAALELAGHGIRVNTILPGGIDTPMTEGFDWTQLEIPMRRVIQPEELAKTIVHLAGSESSFTTGAELVVDGGQMLNIPRYDAMHGLTFTGPLQQS